jgi:hypothetical protein
MLFGRANQSLLALTIVATMGCGAIDVASVDQGPLSRSDEPDLRLPRGQQTLVIKLTNLTTRESLVAAYDNQLAEYEDVCGIGGGTTKVHGVEPGESSWSLIVECLPSPASAYPVVLSASLPLQQKRLTAVSSSKTEKVSLTTRYVLRAYWLPRNDPALPLPVSPQGSIEAAPVSGLETRLVVVVRTVRTPGHPPENVSGRYLAYHEGDSITIKPKPAQ